eukprot:CAMPEP_0197501562 /NCGR_PEP_ID=MMETSP1312-20131121/801_1 /TAXON_ID=464262 /ORGANISM="Genus nov. species nov., Strain RCC2335" /LENGTH=318 /DNA_ID=CAMNT_0043047523 /DNA_START=133 /DNA_END=1084 /DNA_ORIENTATION=-
MFAHSLLCRPRFQCKYEGKPAAALHVAPEERQQPGGHEVRSLERAKVAQVAVPLQPAEAKPAPEDVSAPRYLVLPTHVAAAGKDHRARDLLQLVVDPPMVRLDSRQVRPRLRLRLALQLDPAAVTRLPKPAAHVVRQAPTVEGVHRDFPAKVFQGVAIRLKPAPPRLGLLRKEFRVFEARQAGEEHRLEAPKPPEEPRVLDLRDEANHRAEGVPQNDAPANQFSRLDLSNEVVGHLVPSEARLGSPWGIAVSPKVGSEDPAPTPQPIAQLRRDPPVRHAVESGAVQHEKVLYVVPILPLWRLAQNVDLHRSTGLWPRP